MGPANRILEALFTSINFRTSGFDTISIAGMHSQTRLIGDMLMFVGGGSASTAGGLKLATFAVLVLIVISEIRGGRPGRGVPPLHSRRRAAAGDLGGVHLRHRGAVRHASPT